MSKKNKKFEHKPYKKSNVDNSSPVKAKKHLGQHFLKDEEVAKQIGDTLTLNNYSKVLEIGPGTGVLTKYLLQKDIDLIAMDLDSESIVYLQQNFFCFSSFKFFLTFTVFLLKKNRFFKNCNLKFVFYC